jgi:hypothetical protein
MEELQLHDLKNMDADDPQSAAKQNRDFRKHLPAVDVQKNARPARHEVPIELAMPAMGRDSNRPMAEDKVQYVYYVITPRNMMSGDQREVIEHGLLRRTTAF